MPDYRIDTVNGRKSLKPRREPYWHRLAAGHHLGYRKLSDSTGTWIAKWRPSGGERKYQALDEADNFEEATKAARAWFDQCEHVSPRSTTVEAGCRSYVDDRRTHKGDRTADDAEARFNRHVYGKPIGSISLPKLKAADISKWLGGLVKQADDDTEVERRSKDTANRDLRTLKAALNFSFRAQLVASDAAWRRVQGFGKVARRRERFLTLTQRTALHKAAAADLKLFIRAVALTAARPGELAAAPVAAFDAKAGTLTLDGKTERRTVPLSLPAVAFFKTCAKDKLPAAPLLSRADGSAWHRVAWGAAMREAVTAAKLPPDVVLYSMRHAAISEMLKAGIDPMSVARLAGTSIEMISKNYGHVDERHVREQLQRVKTI